MSKLATFFDFISRVGIMLILFLLIQLPPVAISIANRYPNNFWLTILLMVIFLMMFAFIIGWARRLYNQYNQLPGGRLRIGMVVLGYFVLVLGMAFFGHLNVLLFHQTQTANNQALAQLLNHNQLATVVFAISSFTLTPVAEELIFRGVLTNLFFKPTWFWPKVVLSGLVFSFAHISTNIVSFCTYCFMGMVLAYVYRRSGSLKNSIALHALNNLVAMAALLNI
ncbi:lysostaphin resistance A-like protein [Limosilactobacillus sp.]|uniref:CPBP family intramembrane glutamic endopeptidase n=1 Tax=Limosilactobacillus sp. TaxID=2773925 RepID=UPI003F031CB7